MRCVQKPKSDYRRNQIVWWIKIRKKATGHEHKTTNRRYRSHYVVQTHVLILLKSLYSLYVSHLIISSYTRHMINYNAVMSSYKAFLLDTEDLQKSQYLLYCSSFHFFLSLSSLNTCFFFIFIRPVRSGTQLYRSCFSHTISHAHIYTYTCE